MLLGCDGVWETKTNVEIINLCKGMFEKKDPPSRIVENLLDKLIAPDTSTGLGCDNMTCIIVDLKNLNLSKQK